MVEAKWKDGFEAGLREAADYLLACDDYGDRNKAERILEIEPPASPAPALPESGVGAVAWQYRQRPIYEDGTKGDWCEWFPGRADFYEPSEHIDFEERALYAHPAPAPAPAPADAAGLVARLVWSEHKKPDGKTCFYDYVEAETPFGRAIIEWKSWKEHGGYTLDFAGDFVSSHNTLDEAKAAAQADYATRILSALDASALAAAAEREAALVRERDEACRLYLDGVMTKRALAAEARVTAAEAERERMEALLIEAKDHIAHNATSLSMQSPDYLLVSRIVAAIRKETP